MASPTEPSDRRPSYRETLARLGTAQKPGRGAPPYSRWVNRRLGRYLAAAAFVLRLTPDQVTVISACFTFAALVLAIVLTPAWWLGVLVAVLLLIGYALDSADGQLARLRGGGSKAGEWLDHVVDATKIGVLHSAVLISFYRFSGERGLVLIVPLAFMVAAFVFFFGMILTDQLRRAAATETGVTYSKPSGGGGALQTLVALPTDYAVLCLSFVLLGGHLAFVVVYSLLALAQVLITAAVLVRWWRELRRVDAAVRTARTT
jgi:phosphatidylglycerophosphate synthase